ncbi:T3SS effector HopA1 family protein [Halomonas sp. EF61]|uniref:lanthionine synthetase LanC family protein n=1 Tax=Halomonas sp. EF61 TaxID=2950869 RepID=UPI0032DE78E1
MSTTGQLDHWWRHQRSRFQDLWCDDDGTLFVDGQRFPLHTEAQADDATALDVDPRVTALQHYLYRHHYIGNQGPSALPSDDYPEKPWQPLSNEQRTSGPWRVLEQLSDGAVAALEGTRSRRLQAGEYLFDGAPAIAVRGDQVWRYRRRWNPRLDTGFHYLFGEVESDACSDDALVRYYLAPGPGHLETLVSTLCRELDDACLPYSLKYVSPPRALWRPDAVVLYVGARYAHQCHARLGGIALTLSSWLRDVTPLWAAPLLPGLAFAQDPDGGLSFGEHRCLALAQGLLEAALAGVEDPSPFVKAHFKAAAIDWQHPHLGSDEEDRLGLRQLTFPLRQTTDAWHPPNPSETFQPRRVLLPSRQQPLPSPWREALAIANQLCADALWYGSTCTWIDDDVDDASGAMTAYARSMNGSLYDGSLGVAAFLTLLAEASHDDSHRNTAVGALWHALDQSNTSTISLYEGRLGIVSQGAWLARRLDQSCLLDGYQQAARTLLGRLPQECAEADLMHGLAGAVLGLFGVANALPELAACCRTQARHYAERLVRQASRSPHGWHWPCPPQPLGLCGLAHGNAGITLAFAAMYRCDQSPLWRQAIDAALAYEDFWYLPKQANWPYLFAEDAASFEDRPEHCGMAWCHGAPGIALSRLALWCLLDDRRYRARALAGFATVAEDLHRERPRAGESFTLCHGPAGNADSLLDAALLLQRPDWGLLARATARRGILKQAGRWKSGLGVADGHATGLMLGLAGTGYFLLRCALREPPPSLLLPVGLLPASSTWRR